MIKGCVPVQIGLFPACAGVILKWNGMTVGRIGFSPRVRG